MNTKTKIWIGVGAYLLGSVAPVIEQSSPNQTVESFLIVRIMPSATAQTADPCRKGLGGEGGAKRQGGEGGEGGAETPAKPNPAIKPEELKQAVAGYKAYVVQQVDRLLADTQVFTDKVIAGDLNGAKAIYGSSRLGWERIEPIAESFEALDRIIDARVDDFKGEDDPEFTGFHRIEMGLFKYNTTKGYEPFAKKLIEDLKGLKACVASLEIEPRDMVRGASELIEEVAQSKITGEEDRYSKMDFWSFKANVEGSEKIVELVRPLVMRINPGLLQQIDRDFASVNQMLTKYALPSGGYMTYDKLTLRDKQMLQADLARLAENLSKLRGVIGV